ncbi:cytochrome P450 [Microbaculum marinisediminis]|uniref:Cytochrome P450 n=1 Tax=Microbaculum marinisediminis TaxID=2931392 RepID=A0AAW5QYE0_9HYPH|nr:cytochrome P450 [Microbaculum sp. A6E488]MCT8972738.1 cytochrome P450 [Microbaculum sp. A6E488]
MDDADARALAERFDQWKLPKSFAEDPYPTYRALLRYAPIKRFDDGTCFISRYADLVTVYRDTKRFSSDKKVEFKPKFGDSPLYLHHTTSLVFNDPPLHTRVRSIIVGALTPKAIARLEPDLIRLVDGLLDRMAEKGTADLIEDFAAAIPIEVIGNLLRVPHEDRGPLREWSLSILGALEPVLTPQQEARGNAAVVEFQDYLEELIADRRKNPGDPSVDVLTRLMQGDGDERLSHVELVQNCIFLLNAGHETTTNLIGNGLHILTEWPDEKRRLIKDPSLIGTAVEEFLRYESSNQLGNRITTEDVELGGEALPKGTRITLCIGAANRDPAQFPDPDRMDISRTPNKHLAFAWGPHLCAGHAFARLEGKTAIGRFLARFPNYELDGAPVRGGRVRFRGFASLPARVA